MRRILLPALAGLCLVLAGCAAAPADAPAPGSAGSAGEVAPAEALAALSGRTTLDGADFDVTAVADRPVVLWFWAPWCIVCRAEAPDIVAVADELEAAGSPVLLLGVPGRGQVAEMADFVADTGTGDLTHVVDDDGAIWRSFGVLTQPAFAFVDDDGVDVVNGALGADGLRERVARLGGG